MTGDETVPEPPGTDEEVATARAYGMTVTELRRSRAELAEHLIARLRRDLPSEEDR